MLLLSRRSKSHRCCSTLRHNATNCNIHWRTCPSVAILGIDVATRCNIHSHACLRIAALRTNIATHCNILQHTATYTHAPALSPQHFSQLLSADCVGVLVTLWKIGWLHTHRHRHRHRHRHTHTQIPTHPGTSQTISRQGSIYCTRCVLESVDYIHAQTQAHTQTRAHTHSNDQSSKINLVYSLRFGKSVGCTHTHTKTNNKKHSNNQPSIINPVYSLRFGKSVHSIQVCIHKHSCTWVYVYINTHMYVCVSTCVHTQTYVCVYKYTHTRNYCKYHQQYYLQIYEFSLLNSFEKSFVCKTFQTHSVPCVCVRVRIYIWIHVYIYIYIFIIYIYIYIYAYMHI